MTFRAIRPRGDSSPSQLTTPGLRSGREPCFSVVFVEWESANEREPAVPRRLWVSLAGSAGQPSAPGIPQRWRHFI